MAFLDNSGDIILDAVLTDLGRKRMAEGNFRITQFALGDDEIDYSLYNKDHPSGSAYYDLEILQTPVFEAFTRENSNINYGLLTFDGNDQLFYLPRLVLNQKRTYNKNTLKLTNGVVYLAVNPETYTYLNEGAGALGAEKVSQAGDSNAYVSFETGIDNNNDPSGGQENRKDFIVNNSLVDNEINLSCDNRFLTSIMPIATAGGISSGIGALPAPGQTSNGGAASIFAFPPGGNTEVTVSLSSKPLVAIATPGDKRHLLNYTLPTIPNLVFDQGDNTQTGKSASDVSEISGPRGIFTAFNFDVPSDLKTTTAGSVPSKFSLYGRTSVSHTELVGVSAGTYDIIDTIVYLRGNTTGANTQLIVRLIRKAA